ncbi:protein kinase domain protein [Penicillium malachiteum]|uniref:Protein kinase domain protein n=1 Tax=Penicillium malachiteum TaxID=1324776 RepID=A0AAD6MZG5_9EURO|nr:protein kinase domain protein [Penicillium malachiteum]
MSSQYVDTLEKNWLVGGGTDAVVYHVTPIIVVKAILARWIQQLSSALAHVEKLGFCHNDLHAGNYFLDSNLNLKLSDFGRATTIGKFLEDMVVPRALPIRDGPLKGSYGLCSARTEQFALGTLHEPYDDRERSPEEWIRFGKELEFPELNRHEVLDGLISACWYNVYPNMALVAYDFKRKIKHMTGDIEPGYIGIDSAKETKRGQVLVRKGLLGPELALSFQPFWRRHLHLFFMRGKSFWQSFLQRFWSWSS